MNTKNTKTVDVTPTWMDILPSLIHLVNSDSLKGRQVGESELRRMAGLADGYVELSKENR